MLLRQYLNSRMFGATAGLGISLTQEEDHGDEVVSKRSAPQRSLAYDLPFANNGFWRQRRVPTEIEMRVSKRLLRLSDQYTPTPCRYYIFIFILYIYSSDWGINKIIQVEAMCKSFQKGSLLILRRIEKNILINSEKTKTFHVPISFVVQIQVCSCFPFLIQSFSEK